jgi:hypothetical protein
MEDIVIRRGPINADLDATYATAPYVSFQLT